MRPSLQQAQQNVLRFWPALFPILLVVISTLAAVTTPAKHSLFVSAIAWLAVALYYGVKVGVQFGKGSAYKRRLSWSSGFLYGLAQVCERASNDRDALWWAQVQLAQIKHIARALSNYHLVSPPSRNLPSHPNCFGRKSYKQSSFRPPIYPHEDSSYGNNQTSHYHNWLKLSSTGLRVCAISDWCPGNMQRLLHRWRVAVIGKLSKP